MVELGSSGGATTTPTLDDYYNHMGPGKGPQLPPFYGYMYNNMYMLLCFLLRSTLPRPTTKEVHQNGAKA